MILTTRAACAAPLAHWNSDDAQRSNSKCRRADANPRATRSTRLGVTSAGLAPRHDTARRTARGRGVASAAARPLRDLARRPPSSKRPWRARRHVALGCAANLSRTAEQASRSRDLIIRQQSSARRPVGVSRLLGVQSALGRGDAAASSSESRLGVRGVRTGACVYVFDPSRRRRCQGGSRDAATRSLGSRYARRSGGSARGSARAFEQGASGRVRVGLPLDAAAARSSHVAERRGGVRGGAASMTIGGAASGAQFFDETQPTQPSSARDHVTRVRRVPSPRTSSSPIANSCVPVLSLAFLGASR